MDIQITRTHKGGATGSDYTVPRNVTFESGETSKTITFSAVDDTVDDDDESVELGFTNLPERVSAGTPSTTTVAIIDDDDPFVEVSFAESSYSVDEAEGTRSTVTVTLDADPERTVDIPITGTGTPPDVTSPGDYTVPASVRFVAGQTSQTITFAATHDTVDDDDESVRLSFDLATLQQTDERVEAGATTETVVAIIDDDDPYVLVSFKEPSYSVGEGGTVAVKVELDADPEREVEIPISVDNQGGASLSDYSGVPLSVIFRAGETSKTINFAATQDTVDDDDESVVLSFGTMPDERVSAEMPDQTEVAIIDDDDPYVRVSFAQPSYSVDEADTVTVTVTLDADPERTVEIPITRTPRNGASGSDYSVAASVTFNAGETSKTITFTATHDTLDDDDESVALSFDLARLQQSDERVLAGATTETIVAIIDDDDPEVRVSFAQPSYTVDEGATVTVTVELDADPERTVEIPITQTPRNGASSGDYSAPASVTFTAGERSKDITFTATHDTLDDDDESVALSFDLARLQQSDERVLAGATTETIVAIIDDDDPEVTVRFAQSSYEVDEGGAVTVTVELDADPERTVEIPIIRTLKDGATGGDYSGVPSSVTFHATETSKTINFAATQDTVDDDDERVELSFGVLPERVLRGTPSATEVAIIDDDDPEVTVRFDVPDYEVEEGSSVTVTVELDADPERTVEIPISATNQGGASGGDYSGVPSSITFNATETLKTITFAATDDTVDDDDERVELSFGVLPERVLRGTPSATTVAIIDDDDPEVTVRFAQSSYEVDEGGSVTVTVELDADPERTVEIPISVDNQGGASLGDYSGVPSSITFNATETSKTIAFSAVDDAVDDDNERVRLSFDLQNVDRVIEGTRNATEVAIIDDDVRGVSVTPTSLRIDEGSDDTYRVVLDSEPLGGNVTVTVVAPDNLDLSVNKTSLTFTSANWDTAQEVRVTADEDNDDIDDQDTITHMVGGADYASETADSVSVQVIDDEDPQVRVSYGSDSYSVGEGSTIPVTVTLSKDPERTVVIPISRTPQNGASSGDYTAPASVTFNATETSKTITFSAVDDTVDDDGESVVLSFGSSLPPSVAVGATAETTVEITDDDDPEVAVSFALSSYRVGEGGTVTITVELDADPERTVVIPISRTENGATGRRLLGRAQQCHLRCGRAVAGHHLQRVRRRRGRRRRRRDVGFRSPERRAGLRGNAERDHGGDH